MTEKEFAQKTEELARLGDVEALTKFLVEHQQQREREWEKDDVLALRSRPLPRYGDVVQRWDLGVGMIYAVTKDGSLMIAFESGCVCCGYQGLEYIGSIYDLKEPPKMAGVPPQKQLE
jgi:hypothetical protein